MATKTHTFEGGVDSTNITVGNSGGASGDAFFGIVVNGASVDASGDDTFQYRTGAAISGSVGGRYTAANSPGTGTNHLRTAPTVTTATRTVARMEFTYPGNPATDTDILIMRHSSANQATVTIHTNGQVSFRNGITYVAASRSSASLVPGSRYAVEEAVTSETGGGANGVIEFIVYALAGGSTFHTHSISGLSTGTGGTAQIRWVNAINTNGWATFDFDNLRVADVASGWLGPIANATPTVDAGANQNVGPAGTVNLSATASDPDGTIAAYAWSFVVPSSGAPSLTGSTTATPSFTSGALGSLYVLSVQVTDDGGATATDTVEVRVPVAGATAMRAVPIDGTGAAWTKAGGSATDGAALSDETDTTYVESPAITGIEQARKVRLQPTAAKASAQTKVRLWTDSGTANATIRLYEGNTVRQTWTQALNTTPSEYNFVWSGGTVSAIGDWGNLFIEVGVTT